ncbi:hypothetical protein BX666DRAFT_1066134 [Dichotomocladium elegans]|nr:hypothetical protein BX666DRAFT_1066134 [Dichotomocladium elegans]
MNDIVLQVEKLDRLNQTYTERNRGLALANDELKGRMTDLENELAILSYRNRTLRQELAQHRNNKLPELEQHFMCDADIPPSQPPRPLLRLRPSKAPRQSNRKGEQSLPEGSALPIKNRRVKVHTCYTLPSLKSKMRKGDPQTFRG